MTSRYPFRYGLQKCIPPGSTAAIPTSASSHKMLRKMSAKVQVGDSLERFKNATDIDQSVQDAKIQRNTDCAPLASGQSAPCLRL